MADKFTYSMLEVVIGQICLHIGFTNCKRTALEVITDVLHNYLRNLLIRIGSYTEMACRTEPTLQDVLLAFKDFSISIDGLQDYVNLFGEVAPAFQVPLYPIPREHDYNILQTETCELVTRNFHIHEHLPIECQSLVDDSLVSDLSPLSCDINNRNISVNIDINNTSTKENVFINQNERANKDCVTIKELSTIDCVVDRPLRELKRVVIKKVGSQSSSYVVVNPELLPEKDLTDASNLTSSDSFVSRDKPKKRKKKKRKKDVEIFEKRISKHMDKKSKKKKSKKIMSTFQAGTEQARL